VSHLVGVNPLWALFHMYELTEIMRQRDDRQFAVALNNLAAGRLSADEVQFFRDRCYPCENQLPTDARNAIHLFSTNLEVNSHNMARMMQIPGDSIGIIAEDSTGGTGNTVARANALSRMRVMTAADTFGLHQRLELKLTARVMLVKNLDIEDGLFNGASGLLEYIEYRGGRPFTLWIAFDDERVGQNTRRTRRNFQLANDIPSNLTPINKTTVEFPVQNSGSVYGIRKQFPIAVAEAMTVHKAQGQTMDVVVVGLGRWTNRNNCYVAFSRAKSIQGLHVVGAFNPPRPPLSTDPTVLEMARLRANALVPKFDCLVAPRAASELQIVFFNVQSLKKIGSTSQQIALSLSPTSSC
jgi:ATP-dependent DNA helicase PIF1